MRRRPVCFYAIRDASIPHNDLFSDRLLEAAKTKVPAPAHPPTFSSSVPTINNTSPAHETPSTHVRLTTTAARRANYRPLPTKNATSAPTDGTKKHKHTVDPRPFHYSEDSGSDDDNSDDRSGDGSSSGDSVTFDAPARVKRQRTSRIVTRSSTRTTTADMGKSGELNSASPSPTITAQPLPAIPEADAPSSAGVLLTSATATPSDLQPVDVYTGAMDAGGSLSRSTSHVGGETGSGDVPSTRIEPISDLPTTDTKVLPATDTEFLPATDTKVGAVAAFRVFTDTTVELAIKPTSSARPSIVTPTIAPHSPPPALSDDIDEDSVPTFLRSHGRRSREVNIFAYLNQVEDLHFRQVLLQYIRIVTNDKSGESGSLPTSKRPSEISHWSSRTRPATIPDFTKGKRTFSVFVDSVFAWWGSIQPSWRSFERGEVSREVNGGWEVLHAPGINGLLNVVMLAFWWVRVLEEQKPKDGIRADYEQFTDDVAWVFSNLYLVLRR